MEDNDFWGHARIRQLPEERTRVVDILKGGDAGMPVSVTADESYAFAAGAAVIWRAQAMASL
jgi:hypothetical protein